jgi:hypothetical protein
MAGGSPGAPSVAGCQPVSAQVGAREAHVFLARQLLAMAEPLRSGLAAAAGRQLFTELTGHDRTHWEQESDTAPTSRLTLAALGPVVAAYEHAMTDGEGRNTWRADWYSPCPRSDAGRYLAFLAGLGYPLSAIRASRDGWTAVHRRDVGR